MTIASTWDRSLCYQRGYDMGTEHRLKGVDAQLGPVVGPLGRSPEGGRNWEGEENRTSPAYQRIRTDIGSE